MFDQMIKVNPIFSTGENEAVHNFISSLQPLHHTTAIFRKNKVNDITNEGKEVKLKDEIRAWTTLLQQEGIERFPNSSKVVDITKNALSASFQGKVLGSKIKNQENRPKCPCGLTHWPSQCYYLNPQRRRKPNWKMNRETAKKVKLFLQKNPKFSADVDEAIKRWEDTTRLKNNVSGSAINSEVYQTEFQQIEAESDDDKFAGTCLAAGSSSLKCSLYQAIVLDSGTNVHIINNALQNRIVSRRKATSEDKVIAGNVTLQPREVVNVELKLNYKGKEKSLTLTDAFSIPDFMANLVSLPRLNKIGLHYDTTDPGVLFKQKENNRLPVVKLTESETGH